MGWNPLAFRPPPFATPGRPGRLLPGPPPCNRRKHGAIEYLGPWNGGGVLTTQEMCGASDDAAGQLNVFIGGADSGEKLW